MLITWRDLAVEDLTKTYDWLEQESSCSGERLLDSVEATIDLLLDNPRAGRVREFECQVVQDIRSLVLDGLPYVIFYRAHPDELEIVRLLHGARDLLRLV